VTSQETAIYHYEAFIATSSGASRQAVSAEIYAYWQATTLTLAAGLNTLPVGDSTTLTATVGADIVSSPFYIEIWDTTTGTELTNWEQCGSGTTCTVTVSQSVATTHTYIAALADATTSYPGVNLQNTSATTYVTWNDSGWSISLTASNGVDASTVTATANASVSPTEFYILIFDENGTFIKSCPFGTTCSTYYPVAVSPGSNLIAFVSSDSTTLPPGNIQASSNTVTAYTILT
jgi:hypothetical protein